MPGNQEVWVRQRAHEIWVSEGQPEGREFDHWYAATAEFHELATRPPKARKAAAKKPAVNKAAAGEKPAQKPAKAKPAEAAPVQAAEAAPKKAKP